MAGVQSVGVDVIKKHSDATTASLFRERLREAGVIEELFEMFEVYLRSHGLQIHGSQIVDATRLPVPKQHNTSDLKQRIKAGKLPKG